MNTVSRDTLNQRYSNSYTATKYEDERGLALNRKKFCCLERLQYTLKAVVYKAIYLLSTLNRDLCRDLNGVFLGRKLAVRPDPLEGRYPLPGKKSLEQDAEDTNPLHNDSIEESDHDAASESSEDLLDEGNAAGHQNPGNQLDETPPSENAQNAEYTESSEDLLDESNASGHKDPGNQLDEASSPESVLSASSSGSSEDLFDESTEEAAASTLNAADPLESVPSDDTTKDLPVISLPADSASLDREPDKITVKFLDGEMGKYDPAIIRRFKVFSAADRHRAFRQQAHEQPSASDYPHDLSKGWFDLVIALVIDKTPLLEAIDEEMLSDNPSLLENLEHALNYLAPLKDLSEDFPEGIEEPVEELLRAVREELHSISPSLAQRILDRYASSPDFSIARTFFEDNREELLEELQGEDIFLSMKSPEEILDTLAGDDGLLWDYPETEELKGLALEKIQKGHQELLKGIRETLSRKPSDDDLLRDLAGANGLLWDFLEGSFSLPAGTADFRGGSLGFAEELQETLSRETDHLEGPSPMPGLVKIAQERINSYRAEIMEALERTGADTSREDLIEYLAGPEAFLLHHYGLVIGSRHMAFIHPEIPQEDDLSHNLTIQNPWSLENYSPWHLEQQIRSYLRSHGIKLPKRIVETDNAILEQDLEVVEKGEALMDTLVRWESLQDEDPEAIALKQFLIERGALNKTVVAAGILELQVSPQNLTLCHVGKSLHKARDFPIIKGKLSLNLPGKDAVKLKFKFSTFDFIPLFSSDDSTSLSRKESDNLLFMTLGRAFHDFETWGNILQNRWEAQYHKYRHK